jgi:hypothetical protein
VSVPYCPDCRIEYEDTIQTCNECGGALAAGPMPELAAAHRGSEEKWNVLMRVRAPETAGIVSGLLESEGIEAEVIDKGVSEFPLPAVGNLPSIEIWVPESEVAGARALLYSVRQDTKACPACGHMSSAGDPACEYCGAAL